MSDFKDSQGSPEVAAAEPAAPPFTRAMTLAASTDYALAHDVSTDSLRWLLKEWRERATEAAAVRGARPLASPATGLSPLLTAVARAEFAIKAGAPNSDLIRALLDELAALRVDPKAETPMLAHENCGQPVEIAQLHDDVALYVWCPTCCDLVEAGEIIGGPIGGVVRVDRTCTEAQSDEIHAERQRRLAIETLKGEHDERVSEGQSDRPHRAASWRRFRST